MLTTSPNFDRIENFLTCGSSPSSVANPGYESNQTPSFSSFILYPIKSPSFQKLLMTSLHDLQFSPLPNSKSRLRLCINLVQCAYQIPVIGSQYCWRTFTNGCLQHFKATKYTLHCFQSEISLEWNGMEYGRKF